MNLPLSFDQTPAVPPDINSLPQETYHDLLRQLAVLREENDQLRRQLDAARVAAQTDESGEIGSGLLHYVLEVLCTLLRPQRGQTMVAGGPDGITLAKAQPGIGPLQTALERPGLARALLGQAVHLTTRYESVLWLPIRQGDGVAVVLCLRRSTADPFTAEDQILGEGLAPLVISALQTGQYRFDLKESPEALATLCGILSFCIRGGGGRVAAMAHDAERLAQRFQLGPTEQAAVRLATILHDIGTVDLAEDLLQREGRLTGAELAQMREHPAFGAQIVLQLGDLGAVVPLVLAHHERWDGTGYPLGLAAEAIPLGAQIVAVVDAFHAMTHPRSGRRPRSVAEALLEVHACADTQVGRRVVDEFSQLIMAPNVLELDAPRRVTGSVVTQARRQQAIGKTALR